MQRGPAGQLAVVIGVSKLVSQGLHAVDRPIEVHQDPAGVAADRHAKRATALAVSRPGIDPAVGEGSVSQRLQRGAVGPEGMATRSVADAHETDVGDPTSTGAIRSHQGKPSSCPSHVALVRM